MQVRRIRQQQKCPKCKQMCGAFVNLRFVDCWYEMRAEQDPINTNPQFDQQNDNHLNTDPITFRKRGQTPVDTGDIVTMRFDQMEDIKVWTWMEIKCWNNEPDDIPEEPEELEEEEEPVVADDQE